MFAQGLDPGRSGNRLLHLSVTKAQAICAKSQLLSSIYLIATHPGKQGCDNSPTTVENRLQHVAYTHHNWWLLARLLSESDQRKS